jgi:ribosome maturation factor RimP
MALYAPEAREPGMAGGCGLPSRQEIEQGVRVVAERVAAELGLEIVELALRGGGRKQMLRVDVDRIGVKGVSIEDCQQMSHALGRALDGADLIPGAYLLEVSSPGADRPIRTSDDVRRNTGRRVIIVATPPDSAEQRSYQGVLLGEEDGFLLVQEDSGVTVRIEHARVLRARQELVF